MSSTHHLHPSPLIKEVDHPCDSFLGHICLHHSMRLKIGSKIQQTNILRDTLAINIEEMQNSFHQLFDLY